MQANSTPVVNVSPVPAQSDKVGEVVLNDGSFAEIYKMRFKHYYRSQHPNPAMMLALLMTHIVVIEGKVMTTDQVDNLEMGDFSKIAKALDTMVSDSMKYRT